MNDEADRAFARLAARGTVEIRAVGRTREWTERFTDEEGHDRVVSHTESLASHDVLVAWWPKGQGGWAGPKLTNVFAMKTISRPTLVEALVAMEEKTRPRWRTIDDLAYERQRERAGR